MKTESVSSINSFWFFLCFGFLGVIAFGTILFLTQGFKLYVVESGSMAPQLPLGAVVLVSPHAQEIVSPLVTALPRFHKGETITFKSGKEVFTHRIINSEEVAGQIFYITKGDTNKAGDRERVEEKQVIGKVVFSVPFVGYLVSFVKSQQGYIFLIIIPATLIIYNEIINIKEEVKKFLAKRKVRELI